MNFYSLNIQRIVFHGLNIKHIFRIRIIPVLDFVTWCSAVNSTDWEETDNSSLFVSEIFLYIQRLLSFKHLWGYKSSVSRCVTGSTTKQFSG